MNKKPSFKEEKLLWEKDIDYVIGIDEVGRGAFAGPIFAAAVIFPQNFNSKIINGVNDSKLLSPEKRMSYSKIIKENALFYGIESIGISYINKYGIGKANSAVFRKVLRSILFKFEDDSNYFVLLDGFHKRYLPGGIKRQKGIVKGDRISLSIAAASILAKVERDNFMGDLGKLYPNYGFFKNKGYGTKLHQNAIKKYGLSKIHRASFSLDKFL